MINWHRYIRESKVQAVGPTARLLQGFRTCRGLNKKPKISPAGAQGDSKPAIIVVAAVQAHCLTKNLTKKEGLPHSKCYFSSLTLRRSSNGY